MSTLAELVQDAPLLVLEAVVFAGYLAMGFWEARRSRHSASRKDSGLDAF